MADRTLESFATIADILDGAAGVSIVLSNENHTFVADTDGAGRRLRPGSVLLHFDALRRRIRHGIHARGSGPDRWAMEDHGRHQPGRGRDHRGNRPGRQSCRRRRHRDRDSGRRRGRQRVRRRRRRQPGLGEYRHPDPGPPLGVHADVQPRDYALEGEGRRGPLPHAHRDRTDHPLRRGWRSRRRHHPDRPGSGPA